MDKQENEIHDSLSNYNKTFGLYTKNYLKWVNPFLNCISRSCHYGAKYPILKVLKAITKIFLLNQIEVIFLAYMINSTKWDIKEKLITNNLKLVKDVVCYSNDQPEYKGLVLYLMILSYGVKFYLNEADQIKDVLEEANKICPNFKCIFQNWAKKHVQLTKRINPKTLNLVYQKLLQQTRKEEPDFNMIVDAIIQNSPAYNSQKNDSKKKQFTEIKKQPLKKVKIQNSIIVTKPSNDHQSSTINLTNEQQNGPAFSSSALYDVAAHGANSRSTGANEVGLSIYQNHQNSFSRPGNFLESSFAGIPKQNTLNRLDDQEECQSLILNLKQGQSQQNIIIQDYHSDNNENYPHTSVINLQRGVSATEKYWVQEGDNRRFT